MTRLPSTVLSAARRRRGAWVLGLALSGAAILPVMAQESLLPEGFGDPAPPQPATPAPKGDAPRNPDGPGTASTTPAPGTATPAPGRPAAAATDEGETDGEDEEEQVAGQLRYDLPPGSRRLLTRVGPLLPESGGLAADAFGNRGGQWLGVIMRQTQTPIASRWSSILLRRTLLSGVNTPSTVNGADFVAERAGLLLRMGEATGARRLIQSVDHDRVSPRLLAIAMQTYLANADPAGLCPLVPLGVARSKNPGWTLAGGMCSAMTGEPGPAGAAMDRVRGRRDVQNFDVLLAEKVLGASVNGRRAVTLQWDDVRQLTSWRFGLATATGSDIPVTLRTASPDYMKGWTALAAMTPMGARVAAAETAAARGVLSHGAYVSLISFAALADDAAQDTTDLAGQLRTATAGDTAAARLGAMRSIWSASRATGTGAGASDDVRHYAALVATARAAAALPVSADVGDDLDHLIASMFTAGYDRSALAWVPVVKVGSRAWAMLAVGLPRPLSGVDAGAVGTFAGDDDSPDALRSQMLVAALAGLGRIETAELAEAAEDVGLSLNRRTRWSVAIDEAAARGEAGTVALLAATGLQGDWDRVPARHIYHITRALRQVGLGSEARMIAVEALTRV